MVNLHLKGSLTEIQPFLSSLDILLDLLDDKQESTQKSDLQASIWNGSSVARIHTAAQNVGER